MMRKLIFSAAVLVFSACSGSLDTPGDENRETLKKNDIEVAVGEPAVHCNLAIFPLYLADTKEVVEDYLTLEEGLEGKKVKVREVGAGPDQQFDMSTGVEEGDALVEGQGQQEQELSDENASQAGVGTVNAVDIENGSDRPLYILAGQVILGGKQDRVIAKDTIVPPGETVEAEVCCVEQGRWTPQHNGAQDGYGYLGFSSTLNANAQGEIRQVVQSMGKSGQSSVWQEVEEVAVLHDAQTDTGTYKQVAEKTGKKVEEYLEALKAAFEGDHEACGYLVFVNGKAATCDLFASPRLLQKFMNPLLRGYALDAINAGGGEGVNKDLAGEAREFLEEMLAARKVETLMENPHSRVDKLETERVIGFSNQAMSLDPASRRPLHINAFAKEK